MDILSQQTFTRAILSLNEDWQVGAKDLGNHLPDGLHGRRSAENDVFGRQNAGLRNHFCASYARDGHSCVPPLRPESYEYYFALVQPKPAEAGVGQEAPRNAPASFLTHSEALTYWLVVPLWN